MSRAFVAVSPPPAVLNAVAAITKPIDLEGARFSTRDQWHLTLQFLGNHVDLEPVGSALTDLDVPAATVQLGGGGAFPTAKRGRVLWLGVSEGASFLARLARQVGELLAPLGYPPDDREFHPHLTLARCKTPSDLRAAVAAIGTEPIGDSWRVEEVVLYESVLRPDGAQYTPRATITLPR